MRTEKKLLFSFRYEWTYQLVPKIQVSNQYFASDKTLLTDDRRENLVAVTENTKNLSFEQCKKFFVQSSRITFSTW